MFSYSTPLIGSKAVPWGRFFMPFGHKLPADLIRIDRQKLKGANMCRKNRTAALLLSALGTGLIIGAVIPSGFIVFIVGVILLAAGILLLTR